MRQLCIAASLLALLTAQSLAALPNQMRRIPATGDHGVYSVQLAGSAGSDPNLTKAYDNFTLSEAYELTGISWSGIFAEPIPAGSVETIEWTVEVWADDAGEPAVSAGPLPGFEWSFGGNIVPGSPVGPLLSVAANGDISPATSTTVGGGAGYDYTATLPYAVLPAGRYWISIIADQTFGSPEFVDPEWQWALGEGADNTYFHVGSAVVAPGLQTGETDLAFQLTGAAVPVVADINEDGFVVISGQGELLGVEFNSAEGNLVPVPGVSVAGESSGEAQTQTAPFDFALSNTSESVTLFNLTNTFDAADGSGAVMLDGELVLPIGYLGTPAEARSDLQAWWGNESNVIVPLPFVGLSVCDPSSGGDVDGNGAVEFADFLRLADNFGRDVGSHKDGDIDCNGTVEFADFLRLAENFGSASGAGVVVPEPSQATWHGASFVLLFVLARRHRGGPPARR